MTGPREPRGATYQLQRQRCQLAAGSQRGERGIAGGGPARVVRPQRPLGSGAFDHDGDAKRRWRLEAEGAQSLLKRCARPVGRGLAALGEQLHDRCRAKSARGPATRPAHPAAAVASSPGRTVRP